MESLKFMIVDDSIIMIKNLTHMLTEMGHEVVATARTGEEAIREYKRSRPDMVTMDITMPDMNGIEATEKIKLIDPEAIIIMVTALGQEQMVIHSIAKGARGYLIKPISQTTLSDTIVKIYSRYYKKLG